MSWAEELYKVYENNCGKTQADEILLPVAHSTANAQVELTLNENGDFLAARCVEKEEAVTIIPVTVDSGVRSSGIAPHPFADKLIYIAGDYGDYVTLGKTDNSKYFNEYITALTKWEQSEYTHPALTAVLAYLKKGCLIADLTASGVFETDENGKLMNSVKIAGIAQEDCFIRFRIVYADMSRTNKTWEDASLWNSFISFNSENTGDVQLCYASGEITACSYKQPSKIRNTGDKGRLISANDENGFAYRGRFKDKYQALSIGFEYSQKMHNALKWLIQRQGVKINSSMVYVAWESALKRIPDVTASFFNNFYDTDDEDAYYPDTVQAYKSLLQQAIFGCKAELDAGSRVMLLVLDSATVGRLSVAMYNELPSSEFLSNMEEWHSDIAWSRYNSKIKKNSCGSFSLYDIAVCAFGTEKGNTIECKPELVSDTVIRLIPCVTQLRRLPSDITASLINKASNPLAYDNSYNFRRVLETACGVIRKTEIERKGECSMALDTENRDRSYLFGRLLAVADMAESDTFEKPNERTTNAKRYWNTFSMRPYAAWQIIEERLRPYLDKLGVYSVRYTKLIDGIMSEMSYEDFTSREKLQPSYLLGYHCQINEFYKPKSKEEK